MHPVQLLDAGDGALRRSADLGHAGQLALDLAHPALGDEGHLLRIATAEDVPDEVAARRVAELGAAGQLGRGEALEVAALGELDGLGGRLEGLDDDRALEAAPPRAAGDLGEQLEGPLRRPEVRQLEGEVGVEDADQGDAREIEPLGDHLRAEEQVELAGAEVREHLAELVLARHGVGVDARHAGAGEELGDDLLGALRAMALPADVGRAARGARGRGRRPVVAEVAAHGAVGPVQRQRHAAMRAGRRDAAGRADARARVAAAVEEEDGLLAAGEALAEGVDELPGEDGDALGVERLAAHVDDAEGGQRAVVDAAGEPVQDIAAGGRVGPGLERGGGGPQDAGGAGDLGAHDRHVAPVVEGRLRLLEGGLVLLVDHHEPQVGKGREDGRAGADDDAGLPHRHGHPRVEALAGRQVAVPDHDLGAEVREPGAQATDGLGRERHLGHQEEGRAAFLDDLADQGDVDLRLARARDAVEEMRPEGPGVERGRDGGDGGGLLGIGRVPGGRHGLGIGEGVVVGDAQDDLGLLRDEALADQGIDRRLTDADAIRRVRARHGALPAGQEVEDHRLLGGAAAEGRQLLGLRRAGEREQAAKHGAHAGADGRGQHGLEHAVEAAAVILGHPLGQAADLGREHRLVVDQGGDGPQLRALGRLRRATPDDADADPGPEGHLHEMADPEATAQRRGHGVGVRARAAVEGDHLGGPGGHLSEQVGHGDRFVGTGGGVEPPQPRAREWAAIRTHIRAQQVPMALATGSWSSTGRL